MYIMLDKKTKMGKLTYVSSKEMFPSVSLMPFYPFLELEQSQI